MAFDEHSELPMPPYDELHGVFEEAQAITDAEARSNWQKIGHVLIQCLKAMGGPENIVLSPFVVMPIPPRSNPSDRQRTH